jgi:hypothetical protein
MCSLPREEMSAQIASCGNWALMLLQPQTKEDRVHKHFVLIS